MATPKSNFIDRFVDDLQTLGLRNNSVLLVHSSLKSFGIVPGGAETIIQGLIQAIGDRGTLLMPALSYQSVRSANPNFDLRQTPSCVGLIPESFRTRSGSLRSLHPTHSVCGIGPLAEEILGKHQNDNTPCGPHSPFHLLPKFDGQILMLGCGLNPNTSMHAIEEIFKPPYLFGSPTIYTLTDRNGRTYQKEYNPHNFKNTDQRYERVAKVLFAPYLKVGFVANAKTHLIETKALWNKVIATALTDPLYFVDQHEIISPHER